MISSLPYLGCYFCSSDKSKRRTKTVKKSAEPKWNQTFIYSHVHRRDFRERMLEITVWDQPRVQEEESEFLGEVGNPARPSDHSAADKFIRTPRHSEELSLSLLAQIYYQYMKH